MVENGFFVDGGCSGSTNGGRLPCDTYAFEAEVLDSRKLNMVGER